MFKYIFLFVFSLYLLVVGVSSQHQQIHQQHNVRHHHNGFYHAGTPPTAVSATGAAVGEAGEGGGGSLRGSQPNNTFTVEAANHLRKSDGCNLKEIGSLLVNDKIEHEYGNLYEKELCLMKRRGAPVRMLEIGFGCGHHNHGTSARMWKEFFEGSSNISANSTTSTAASSSPHSPLHLFEIDFGPKPEHTKCVEDFLLAHPHVVDGIFLGDQSNVTFLNEVMEREGDRIFPKYLLLS